MKGISVVTSLLVLVTCKLNNVGYIDCKYGHMYGMYFVSKFNGLKFNAKDGDYRECNGSKVSILVHKMIVWIRY